MIIWINGPFGAGKTTLADHLASEIPDAVIYDPELLGNIIHRAVPKSRNTDFQDFPMWRTLVAQFAVGLHSQFGKTLIVPMTLVKPAYIEEIFGDIKQHMPMLHVYLEVSPLVLEKRIREDKVSGSHAVDDRTRSWRLQKMATGLAAKAFMPEGTVFLDGEKSASELVAQVLSAMH